MTPFTCECLRCGTEFTESLPRVFCPPCRPLAAAKMAEAQAKFYLDHPGFPMPGDRVRRKTREDDAFEHAVLADVAALPGEGHRPYPLPANDCTCRDCAP